MHAPNHAKFLDVYRALPADLRTLVNLLAVYYGYCSLTNIAKCLAGLGIKEGNRVLKAETVKARLRPLIAEGLLEENVRPGGTRCARGLAESIIRQLVAENEFEKYAAEVFALNPPSQGYYRYNTAEDCIREARIHFHRRDYPQMQSCLAIGRRYPGNLPSHIDLYLSWFLNPLDVAWFQQHHPAVLPEMAGYVCLHQLIYLYRQPQLEAFFQHQLVDGAGKNDPVFLRLYLEIKLLRGEWDEVGGLLRGAEEPEQQAIAAMLAFLQGDFADAAGRYEKALSLFRKLSGQRNGYFYGLAGLFYPLAILKGNDGKLRNKLPTLLNQAAKAGGYWSGVYQYLSMFVQFQQGELHIRDQLLHTAPPYRVNCGFRESGSPETVSHPPLLQSVMFLLIKFWLKADFTSRIDAVDQQLYAHLAANGYCWPAAELAKVFSHIEHAKSPQWDQGFFKQGHAALADLFVSRADWEVALDALLNLPVGDRKAESAAQAEKPTRLIWLLSYDERDHHVDIEPREQRQQAKGGWSKGRAVALKRLAHERQNFDYLSEQDHKICAHIKEYRDSGWYGGGTSFEFDSSTPQALIGHPLLFWADAHEVRVDVAKGEAELRVKKLAKNDKIQISLEPAPGHEQKFHIGKETPTRLRVVEFSADHHKVYGVLGPKGLEVPASAQDKVLQTLTSISGLLTVHSDIGGSSSTAEQVDADATPRIHLLPHGEGLRVALLV
ncbi:ATP-dependent helicase, partial [Methylomonas sp. WSC-6]|nr:ATP-dependent helicase [Methylomonas sp. WSC-6]